MPASFNLKLAHLVVERRLRCISLPTTAERLACAYVLHVIKFKACSDHEEDTGTNLDMIVRPSHNLAIQGSQRKTELAFAHDFLAGVLTNVSLQMLDFRQDYLRAIIVL